MRGHCDPDRKFRHLSNHYSSTLNGPVYHNNIQQLKHDRKVKYLFPDTNALFLSHDPHNHTMERAVNSEQLACIQMPLLLVRSVRPCPGLYFLFVNHILNRVVKYKSSLYVKIQYLVYLCLRVFNPIKFQDKNCQHLRFSSLLPYPIT